jgi:hypothetical protein
LSELELLDEAYRMIRTIPHVQASCQVPILGRCIDLVYLRRGLVYTVEFKLKNWRRALLQARDHRLASDFSYICMPRRAMSHYMKVGLTESGIGLLFISNNSDWPFDIILRAKRSDEVWTFARDKVRRYVIQTSEG